MAEPFLAEIRMFAGNFAPRGWAMCNGSILAISQNTALFSLLGTNYGGNGTSNFGLPNLQGSVPIGQGTGPGLTPREVGETGGEQAVTLLTSNMPAHTHIPKCLSGAGGASSPAGDAWASGVPRGKQLYASGIGTPQTMNAGALTSAGGNLPHNNMPPYLALTFIIAMAGIFPARN